MTDEGLPRSTRRAIVFLAVLTLFASGVNLFWTAHLVQQANHARCATVVTLATIPVPGKDITPGARRFDAALTAAFAARARELGCL